MLLEKDEDVDAIWLNMFCGQLPADKVGLVIREAVEKKYVTKPMVCRIHGRHSDEANEIIRQLKLNNIVCVADFDEAGRTVVKMGKAAREQKLAMKNLEYFSNMQKYSINPIK